MLGLNRGRALRSLIEEPERRSRKSNREVVETMTIASSDAANQDAIHRQGDGSVLFDDHLHRIIPGTCLPARGSVASNGGEAES